MLSTQELLRRWEVTGADAETLLATRRDKAVVLDHPRKGVAILHQHPLSEKQLAPALTEGLTVPDWLRLRKRAVKEVAVRHEVPDLTAHMLSAEF